MNVLSTDLWRRLLLRSAADADVPLFGPLFQPPASRDGTFILGRLAQTLDGFIATLDSESYWISGPEDIAHTHRLRALFDVVVVGAATVRADDPQLTTRLVEGPSPVRVVIDPRRRLDPGHRVFRGPPKTLVFCGLGAPKGDLVGKAEVVRVPDGPYGLDIHAMIAALGDRGLRRIFVEGGGVTVSRFLAGGVLDRLHITVAPVVIGGGIPAFALPPAAKLAAGRRFYWSVHRMGTDVLMDIPLKRHHHTSSE